MQITPLIRNTYTRSLLTVVVVLCFGGVASGQSITPTTLPDGDVGVSYTQTLTANGFVPVVCCTWTTPGTSWPAGGLTFFAPGTTTTAQISGTPTATISFTVTATDDVSSASQSYTITINPAMSGVAPAALPAGDAGVTYNQNLSVTGGTAPFTWSVSAVALPAGIILTPSGSSATLNGSTTAGTYNFTVKVTDNAGGVVTTAYTLVINPAMSISPSTLPPGDVGVTYNQNLSVTGGTAPFAWSISAGALPTGITLTPSGATATLSGSTAAGTYNFTVKVTDNAGGSTSQAYSLTINPALSITTPSSLPPGEVTAAYSQQLNASGGSGSYTWALINSTSLPQGLILNTSTGLISGTPASNTAGPHNFTVQVTDTLQGSASLAFSLNIIGGPSITNAPTLPSGTVNASYAGVTLTASGGTSPFTWSITVGALPAGLTLNGTTGAITGTPTAQGTFNLTVQVTDAKGVTGSKQFAVTIANGLIITNAPTLPTGEVNVAYSQTFAAAGGTQPYTWSTIGGALPGGLSLNAATGTISGTPNGSGTFNFTIQVKDSNGVLANRQFALTIAPQLVINTAPNLPGGSAGTFYSQTISASGGVTPYSWSVASGALPAGLSLNPSTGVISGTPSASGNFNFIVQVTDAASVTASKQFTMTSASGLTITTPPELPGGAVGAGYSLTLGAAGGTQPYTWSITVGALPAGMSFNASSGVITGAPTSAGTFKFTAQVTDRASVTANKQFTLSVASSLVISTPSTLPSGSIGALYSLFLSAAGGTAPYRWSVSSGSLPGGLTLFADSGGIAGTPTSAGTYTFTVQVTDNASRSAHKDFTLIIAAGLVIATPSPLPDGIVGQLYSQTLAAAGGSTPYHWLVVDGTIPAGLSLNPATGVISGTPTVGGNFNFGVQVTDNASATSTKNFSINIVSSLAITTTALPGGTVGGAYSQALVVSGGKPPYAWSITTGTIAPGLSLSSSDGSITGNPTTAGTFNFTVEVSDSASAAATQQLSITITPGLSITTPDPLPGATVGVTYSVTLTVSGGQSPYTWSIISGSLPQGLTLDPSTGIIEGKPTAGGNFSFTIQVVGSARTTATKNFKLVVGVAKPPDMTVTGLPATSPGAQQVSFNLNLASGYPLEITGRATLTFQADAAAPADDPAIQFSTGGRTVDFTIPANATTAVFPGGQISLQTGTVSGTIHLSFALKAAGADLPVTGLDQSLTIARSAPVIQRVDVQRSGTTITISVVAFSPPRELTQAHLVFTPTPGSNLQTTDVVEKLNDPAAQWYSSATSVQYGSQVLVVFGFTASQGSVNTVQSVSVTLTNSQGNSQAVSATF